MKSNIKHSKGCKAKLRVEINANRVEECFQAAFRQLQKTARLPGFREGKVPFDMIEKNFQAEASEEVLRSLIPESYHEAVAAHKLSPVSLPAISEIRFERGKPLAFEAEFEKSPDISLKHYKGIRIQKMPTDVHPEEVERGLTLLRDSKAEFTPIAEPRAVGPGDFIVADVEGWQDGRYVPGRKGVLLSAEPGGGQDDFYEKILGAQIDEFREISAGAPEADRPGSLAASKPLYKIWVRGIREKHAPALDEALAKAFGEPSVESLKEAVRRDLAKRKQSESTAKMQQELCGKLLELASFELPPSVLAKQKNTLVEQSKQYFLKNGVSEAQLEHDKEAIEHDAQQRAARQIQLHFILRKIAQLENIRADEAQVESRLEALAEESKRPMEEVRGVFEDDLRDGLCQARTIEFLLAHAKVDESPDSSVEPTLKKR